MPDASDLSRVAAVTAGCFWTVWLTCPQTCFTSRSRSHQSWSSPRRAAGARPRLRGNKEEQFSTGKTAEQSSRHAVWQVLLQAVNEQIIKRALHPSVLSLLYVESRAVKFNASIQMNSFA